MLKDACGDRAELSTQFEALEAVSQQLDRDVDHLVWQLRPTALDDLGLRAALANYVQDWSRRVGISAELHTSGLLDDRLPRTLKRRSIASRRRPEQRRQAFAGQERRSHARATADHVMLIVEDDGVGFIPVTRGETGRGFGLLGMQERATLVGATLHIESAVGKGTTIFVRMGAAAPAGTQLIMSERTEPLRILLADDHVTVRHGLKLPIDSQPDMEVVAEAATGTARFSARGNRGRTSS